jgi:hypothetical protein
MAFKSLTNVGPPCGGFNFGAPNHSHPRPGESGGFGHFGGGGLTRSPSLGSPSACGGFDFQSPQPSSGGWSSAPLGGDGGGGFFSSLFSGGGGGGGSCGGGGGGGGGFSSLTNVAAPAPAPHYHGGGSGFGMRSGGILRAGAGGGAVCAHGAGARTSFAPEVKAHDGLLTQHASFDALVGAMTHGELSPGTAGAPGREQVMAMSDLVYRKYALASPALCAQLNALADDLVGKLLWAKQVDEQNAAQGASARPAAVPVLGGGGGSTARLRSGHLPAAVFMQSLLRLASAQHPAY